MFDVPALFLLEMWGWHGEGSSDLLCPTRRPLPGFMEPSATRNKASSFSVTPGPARCPLTVS